MKGGHNKRLKLETVKIREKCTQRGENTATLLRKQPVNKINQEELRACG